MINLLVGGVDVLSRVEHRLLDRAGRHEAEEDVHRAGLVVGTRGASTTEGLLTHNGTSALVVVVHHTRGIAQQVAHVHQGVAVRREDGAGKGVLGGRVDQSASLVELVVVVGVDGDDRAEDLLDHGHRLGVLGLDDGRLDVVTGRVVTLTADQNLAALVLGLLDQTHDLVEGVLGNDGADEMLELVHGAHANAPGSANQLLLQATLPERLGDIQAGKSTALLALVFKGSTDALRHHHIGVGRLVDHVEVLATSLTNNAGVAAVLVEVRRDLLPQRTEDVGRAREVQASELAVIDRSADDRLGVTRDELDDTSRHTGLAQDLVHDVVGVDRHGRGLPNHDVTDQGRGHDQVASNGREVEGRHGKHEALEGTVLGTVPHTRGVAGGLDLIHVVDVLGAKTQEVTDLRTSVDLSLPHVLALAHHGGGQKLVAVLVRNQVSSFETDGSALAPGEVRPSLLGLERALNSGVDHRLVGLVVHTEGLGVVTGVDLLVGLARLDLLAVNDKGDLDGAGSDQLIDSLLQLGTVDRVGLKVALESVKNLTYHRLIEDLRELKLTQSGNSSRNGHGWDGLEADPLPRKFFESLLAPSANVRNF